MWFDWCDLISCSNIFTPSRLHFRKKCPGMLLCMGLVWKLYQWRSWRRCHAFMKKGSGRSIPFSSSVKAVQLAVLSWALMPSNTIMGYILRHRPKWPSDCLLHSSQMVLGSIAMGMWMVLLDPGSTILRSWGHSSLCADAGICSPNRVGWNCYFFELLIGILAVWAVGTEWDRKKEKEKGIRWWKMQGVGRLWGSPIELTVANANTHLPPFFFLFLFSHKS